MCVDWNGQTAQVISYNRLQYVKSLINKEREDKLKRILYND